MKCIKGKINDRIYTYIKNHTLVSKHHPRRECNQAINLFGSSNNGSENLTNKLEKQPQDKFEEKALSFSLKRKSKNITKCGKDDSHNEQMNSNESPSQLEIIQSQSRLELADKTEYLPQVIPIIENDILFDKIKHQKHGFINKIISAVEIESDYE